MRACCSASATAPTPAVMRRTASSGTITPSVSARWSAAAPQDPASPSRQATRLKPGESLPPSSPTWASSGAWPVWQAAQTSYGRCSL